MITRENSTSSKGNHSNSMEAYTDGSKRRRGALPVDTSIHIAEMTAIKHCPQDCPQWRDSRKKHNIQGDLRTLQGNECELEEMRFLRKRGMFEEIVMTEGYEIIKHQAVSYSH